MEDNNILLYKTIKKPLLNIICQYFPYKYNLTLGLRSKHYQTFHQFSFTTYKYLNLLSRSINFDYCTSINPLQKAFIQNHLNFFPIEKLKNSTIISQWFVIQKMNLKQMQNELIDLIFKINLHLNQYPYIIITNQEEYNYYLKFEEEFQDALLLIQNVPEENDDDCLTFISLSSTNNIVYLYLDHLSYFELTFPKLKYLILSTMEIKYTFELNKMISPLEYLMIHTMNEIFLHDITLNSIKYLSIDAECLMKNNNYTYLLSQSFPELLSFSINRIIHENQNLNNVMDFLKNQKIFFPQTQFPKLIHLDIFEKHHNGNYLPKLVVISHEWITKQRNPNDATLSPLELDCTIELWESLRAVQICNNINKEFKLKTLSIMNIPKSIELVSFTQLTHLKIPLSNEVKGNLLKSLFSKINITLTHLDVFNITHNNLKIVFSFQLPNLTEFKIVFPENTQIPSIEIMFNHSSIKMLKTLSIIFISKSIQLEQLFEKYSFESLESFHCDSVSDIELCLKKTFMPSLKYLGIVNDKLNGELYSMIMHFEKLECIDLLVSSFENKMDIQDYLFSQRQFLRLSLKHLALIFLNDCQY